MKAVLSLLVVMSFISNSINFDYKLDQSDYELTNKWVDSVYKTPLDVSGIVLDAPAGKYGFVKVKDGHFIFENGKRVKFWGVNLALAANFPSYEDADRLAEKLATLGFNAVRIHNIDNDNYYGSTIFDRSLNHTRKFDEKMLDKLDYLISALKARGIYIVMEVHANRKFKIGDEVAHYDNLTILTSKVAGYFDDTILKLKKDYADELFSHVNPYTGLALKDDPVLAMVGISNEDYLYRAWVDGTVDGKHHTENLPAYYRTMLDSLYNNFLINKYQNNDYLTQSWSGTYQRGNLIQNGGFEDGLSSNWELLTQNSLSTNVELNVEHPIEGNSNIKFGNNRPAMNSSCSDLILKQSNLQVRKGRTYELSFYIKSINSGKSTIKVRLGSDSHLERTYGLDENFMFGPSQGWTQYKKTFVATEDTAYDPRAYLSFNCGWCWGDIDLDNITLVEVDLPAFDVEESLEKRNVSRIAWVDRFQYSPQRLKDQTEFYYELITNYFSGMKTHLKEAIGIQIPISTSNIYSTNAEIMARTIGDYMDAHTYWDHPQFNRNMNWSTKVFSQRNDSIINTGTETNKRYFNRWFEQLVLNRVEGMPFVVSEWNHVFPNDFEFEGAPMMTAYASLHDWDGLFIYSFSETNNFRIDSEFISYWFSIIGNPSKLAQMRTYSIVFLNNLIKPAQETYEVQYNNDEVLSSTVVNGSILGFNIKDGLPTALVYTHKIKKKFNQPRTYEAKDILTREKDYMLSTRNIHISDTKEIMWDFSDRNSGVFTINTPFIQSITGTISGKKLKTDNITLELTSNKYPNGSISLQPLDNKPIFESSNALLTILSYQYNSGQKKNINNGLDVWGNKPVMMHPMTGKITLDVQLRDQGELEAFQLNSKGEIVHKIPIHLNRETNKAIILLNNQISPYIQIIRKKIID